MRRKCGRDAGEMCGDSENCWKVQGRCKGDAGEIRGRCGEMQADVGRCGKSVACWWTKARRIQHPVRRPALVWLGRVREARASLTFDVGHDFTTPCATGEVSWLVVQGNLTRSVWSQYLRAFQRGLLTVVGEGHCSTLRRGAEMTEKVMAGCNGRFQAAACNGLLQRLHATVVCRGMVAFHSGVR